LAAIVEFKLNLKNMSQKLEVPDVDIPEFKKVLKKKPYTSYYDSLVQEE